MGKRKIWLLILAIVFSLLFCNIGVFAETNNTLSRKYVVVLDPGHGGMDSGVTVSYNGKKYYESDMTWKIAYYLKKELKKYPNIKVYLTRAEDECPKLSDRVAVAKEYNADLLVSLHINSASSSARGASVLASAGNYRSYLAEEEKIFGGYVMNELTKLGIYMRCSSTGGIEYKLSANGSRYPNGKLSDYYQIVSDSVRANIPGVIIEHAFLTNYSDFISFLSSSAKLKKIGQADARAIVKYFNRLSMIESEYGVTNDSSEIENGWVCKYGKYFYYQDGEIITDKLFKVDGNYYYVDSNGVRQTGWVTYQNKKYYFDSDGKAHIKWLKLDGDKYYFSSKGVMYEGVHKTSSGKYYVFDTQGRLQLKKFYTFNGKTYYTDSRGIAVKGHKKIDGNYYYFDLKTCAMIKSKLMKTNKGNYLYAQSNGILYNKGFLNVSSKRYYFKSNGVAYKGHKKINGNYYYFDPDNANMITSAFITTPKGNYLYAQSNGIVFNKGLKKIGTKTYYFKSNGVAYKGWKNIDGNWYFFRKVNARMLKGCTITIDKVKCTFDKNGVCIKGKE